ncbi:hypothetical protein LCGC14_1934150 [marine sediment metagenome]|uniref:Uncharacterized protein n=1 Tax=marine sediment metagenome TaxID=412755 RepID=A0A0F9FML9_9ZZZZ
MPKPAQDALQAMREAMEPKKGEVVLTLDSEVKRYLAAFTGAFDEVSPDTPFSVLDIVNWAHKYQALRSEGKDTPDFVLPAIFYNAYALGRLLKKSQVDLDIQFAGTYGNRAIYTVGRPSDG